MNVGIAPEGETLRVPASSEVLERNLRALGKFHPKLAERLRAVNPDPTAIFDECEDGTVIARLERVGMSGALCSARDPRGEAKRIATRVDIQENAAIIVLGFGLGYHVQELVAHAGEETVVCVYEPDIALLRAVLERIDHAATLSKCKIITSSESAEIQSATQGVEAMLAIGTHLLEHPASRARLAGTRQRFCDAFTEVTHAVRTTIVTTLVQSDVTIRNFMMNAFEYASTPGLDSLKDAASGFPAIVVSAGPSLERNLHLLEDPRVRGRVVIIAVQTVLKPMLERGIRPDFVTALDHHEISKRFYEGLTAADVEGVTLIAEPKANAAIIDAFPGTTIVSGDPTVERILGEDLAPGKSNLTPGATVAHLAYYVARHLGCDPVILIGQDLGFTDGQYYASGAAIHNVWGAECNEFNTLETMEWQRIARNRPFLRQFEDVYGNAIYSDAQMATYLAQFIRDFASDTEQGRLVVDATEGGVRKPHALVMTLQEALDAHTDPARSKPDFQNLLNEQRAPARTAIHDRLEHIRADLQMIHRGSQETLRLLKQLPACIEDTSKANRLIRKVHAIRDKVEATGTAFELVQRLNQAGTLKRYKVDRSIRIDNAEGIERQRRQIERDALNVQWVSEIAETLSGTVHDASRAALGGEKVTRDQARDERTGERVRSSKRSAAITPVLVLSSEPEKQWRADAAGTPAVITMLKRLLAVDGIQDVAIVTDESPQLDSILSESGLRSRVRLLDDTRSSDQIRESREHRARVYAARRFSHLSWRGGIAQLTIWDELLDPDAVLNALDALGTDSALLIGSDWCAVDTELTAKLIDRHLESVELHPFTFANAAPGLAPFVCSRKTIESIRTGVANNNPFASIGGMMGYMPSAPKADPLASTMCVQIDERLRDAGRRMTASSTAFSRELSSLGLDSDTLAATSSLDLIKQLEDAPTSEHSLEHLLIDVGNSTTPTLGIRTQWNAVSRDGVENRSPFDADLMTTLVSDAVSLNPDVAITLHGTGGFNGSGDPASRSDLAELIEAARTAGAGAVHVRTDLSWEDDEDRAIDALLRADVVSIDVLADSPQSYARITGSDDFKSLLDRAQRLLEASRDHDGPWLIARATRCDAAVADLESFYDRWVHVTGSAVIDPLPESQPGERISPLKSPKIYTQNYASSCMRVDENGYASLMHDGLSTPLTDTRQLGVAGAWRALCDQSSAEFGTENAA